MARLNMRATTQVAYKAVVLGGSKGLGRQLTQLGLANSWNVLNISRSSAGLGDRIGEIYADLTKPEDVLAVCEHLKSIRFNYFFWVAGKTMPMGPFAGLHDAREKPRRPYDVMRQEISDMIAVNVAGAMPIVHTAWTTMRCRPDCALVVVASRSGLQPKANEVVYAATKAFQVQFTRSLWQEAQQNPNGPRVLLFTPGGMKSEFWDTNPELAAGLVALVFFAAGVAGAMMVRMRLRERPRLLEATVAELAKDRERIAAAGSRDGIAGDGKRDAGA